MHPLRGSIPAHLLHSVAGPASLSYASDAPLRPTRACMRRGRLLWSARRHIRSRKQHHELPHLHLDLLRFVVWSRKRIRDATETPLQLVSFLVGPFFLVGSMLFIAGGIGQVLPGYVAGEWPKWQESAAVDVPYLVRCAVDAVRPDPSSSERVRREHAVLC